MTACNEVANAIEGDGLYVYCIADSRVNWLLGPIGLDYEMVYTMPCKGLCAIVHSCRAKPYESKDPQAVQAWVIAHQRVVDAAAKAFGAVLPMTFNMIVHDSDGGAAMDNLKTWMEQNCDGFRRRLDKLIGRAEYGVQICWDRLTVAEQLIQTDPALAKVQEQARNKPKGTAYMLDQKLFKATRAALERQANDIVERFYTSIRQCVDEVRVEKPKKPADGKQMLLNLSCLAETGGEALSTVLEEIQQIKGISVRFTGPWPPYSFVSAA